MRTMRIADAVPIFTAVYDPAGAGVAVVGNNVSVEDAPFGKGDREGKENRGVDGFYRLDELQTIKKLEAESSSDKGFSTRRLQASIH